MNASYFAFVDECGDTSIPSKDSGFPVFVVSMCVIRREAYYQNMVPPAKKLKKEYIGSEYEQPKSLFRGASGSVLLCTQSISEN